MADNRNRNNNNFSRGNSSQKPYYYNNNRTQNDKYNNYYRPKNQYQSQNQSENVLIEVNSPFVDTHCHVDYIFQKLHISNWQEFLQKNKISNKLEGVISVFCDPAALSPSFGTWQEQLQTDIIYGIFGIHPHNAKYYSDSVEEKIIECLKHPKAVAWGEMGLDFFKDISPREVQLTAFEKQLKKAVELSKPIVIHSRDAEKETIDLFKKHVPKDHKIHLHCFGESESYAVSLLADYPNLFIGLTGSITFRNSDQVRDIIKDIIPSDRILLETDGPYMAPYPLPKGTIAHPGHIPLIAKEIATLKQMNLEEFLQQIRKNTKTMYGF